MRTKTTLLVYYPKQLTDAPTTLTGPVAVPNKTIANRLFRAGYNIYTYAAKGIYTPRRKTRHA